MMKMQFINGGHKRQPNQNNVSTRTNTMNSTKRQASSSSSSSRFNMNNNMRLKSTGCSSCSGVR